MPSALPWRRPAARKAICRARTVIGVLSLILWALFLVVTAKYVLILLRADNKGEGGTLSLMALAQRALGSGTRAVRGAGSRHDRSGAVLRRCPASPPPSRCLSAVEGLEVAAPQLQTYVVPLTVLILIALFAMQSRGTAGVAVFFGPVMTMWFVAIGAGRSRPHRR